MEQDQLDNIVRFIAAAGYQCERATETALNVAKIGANDRQSR